MKQVTIKEIEAVVNGSEWGDENHLLNSIICLMNSLADCYKSSEHEVYREYAEVLYKRCKTGYQMLDTIGYYDDVRK